MKSSKNPTEMQEPSPKHTAFEKFVSAIAQVSKVEVDALMKQTKSAKKTQKRGRKPKKS